jgi:hypothetical protein
MASAHRVPNGPAPCHPVETGVSLADHGRGWLQQPRRTLVLRSWPYDIDPPGASVCAQPEGEARRLAPVSSAWLGCATVATAGEPSA